MIPVIIVRINFNASNELQGGGLGTRLTEISRENASWYLRGLNSTLIACRRLVTSSHDSGSDTSLVPRQRVLSSHVARERDYSDTCRGHQYNKVSPLSGIVLQESPSSSSLSQAPNSPHVLQCSPAVRLQQQGEASRQTHQGHFTCQGLWDAIVQITIMVISNNS